MRVGENEREKERSAAGIDWCLLGSSARDRSVLSLSPVAVVATTTTTTTRCATRSRSTGSLDVAHELGRRERRDEREDARSPLRILLGYGDVSRDAILARSLANYFVRPLACARLEARRVATLSPFPLSFVYPSWSLFSSLSFPRGDLPCRRLFSSLSLSQLSRLTTEHPRSLAFPFSSSLRREKQGTSSPIYVSVVSVQLEFRRGSPGILVLPPLPPLTPSRRKRLVCHKRQLDRVDRPRFNSLPLPLLLLPSFSQDSRVP